MEEEEEEEEEEEKEGSNENGRVGKGDALKAYSYEENARWRESSGIIE